MEQTNAQGNPQNTKKTALVTGSYKGLGLAIAKRLATEKEMNVIISGRDLGKVQASQAELAKSGCVVDAIALDVESGESVSSAFSEIQRKYGTLDVLINNAGVNPTMNPAEGSFETVSPEVFEATFRTNAAAVLRVIQAALPLMRKAGYGRIVNVSTEMASLHGIASDFYPLAISYRVSKLALNGVTALLGKELAGTNILVNAYSPGWLQTDMGGPSAPFTAEEGAETALYLATLPQGGPNGRFFAEMRKFGGPMELPW
jgi:NAD(P)-dependent dehydrogenase (short-subunit alcohol dehydrogenase family)